MRSKSLLSAANSRHSLSARDWGCFGAAYSTRQVPTCIDERAVSTAAVCCGGVVLQVEALARSVLRDPLHITVGERNTAQVGPCLLLVMLLRGLFLSRSCSLPRGCVCNGPATSALTLNPAAHGLQQRQLQRGGGEVPSLNLPCHANPRCAVLCCAVPRDSEADVCGPDRQRKDDGSAAAADGRRGRGSRRQPRWRPAATYPCVCGNQGPRKGERGALGCVAFACLPLSEDTAGQELHGCKGYGHVIYGAVFCSFAVTQPQCTSSCCSLLFWRWLVARVDTHTHKVQANNTCCHLLTIPAAGAAQGADV